MLVDYEAAKEDALLERPIERRVIFVARNCVYIPVIVAERH